MTEAPYSLPELSIGPTIEGKGFLYVNKDATQPDADFDKLLGERQSVHGDFSDNCQMTSDFMDLLYGCPNWKNFTPLHKVGLYQILHKIGRIASGDPNYPDHWNDIAGYAIQTVKRLPKE